MTGPPLGCQTTYYSYGFVVYLLLLEVCPRQTLFITQFFLVTALPWGAFLTAIVKEPVYVGSFLRKTGVYVVFIIASFQSLLDEPNPNSPANNVAAQLYQDNRREYTKKVRVIVEESWIHH